MLSQRWLRDVRKVVSIRAICKGWDLGKGEEKVKEQLQADQTAWRQEFSSLQNDVQKIATLEKHLEFLMVRFNQCFPPPTTTGSSQPLTLTTGSAGLSAASAVTAPLGSTSGLSGLTIDNRAHKLHFPCFDGDDPDGWLLRVSCYFDINNMMEAERLLAVAICLEGPALALPMGASPSAVSELDRVSECATRAFPFHHGFVSMSTTIIAPAGHFVAAPMNVTEEVLESAFLNSLKVEILAEVMVMEPSGLDNMMKVTQLAEKKLGLLQSGRGPNPSLGPSKTTSSSSSPSSSVLSRLNITFLSPTAPSTTSNLRDSRRYFVSYAESEMVKSRKGGC
ncbi:hypothetical protein TorRG33x02_186700 [Trema orientale]|uniref:Uncharacterized protein n=1 Tax=Trema orientale TaxID=63057 RepID=A0A2P5EIZ6_TREOI|nr:hypothetical protein TorRG33x02_186700 [Trema orientale]